MKKLLAAVLLSLILAFPASPRRHASQGIIIEIHAKTDYESNRLKRLSDKLNFTGQAMVPWWRIIVLNKPDWTDALIKYNLEGRTDSAFTVLGQNVTYVNEEYLFFASDSQAEFTLAHEAGHMICGCMSEDIANKIGKILEK